MRTLFLALLPALLLACTGDDKGEHTGEVDDSAQPDDTDAPDDSTSPDDSTAPDDADGDGVPAAEDCDDADPSVGAGGTWYTDADGDGYGASDSGIQACDQPLGTVASADDCDDADADTHPGATETCDDPADRNCDGSVGYTDADGDGYAACEECDDSTASSHPDAEESCDGLDNNCDGEIDEAGATGGTTYYADRDGDGYGDPDDTTFACSASGVYTATNGIDCDDAATGVSPGAAELCDAIDNDCDGAIDEAGAVDETTWYTDSDADGYGDPASSTLACDQPDGTSAYSTDCDDTDPAYNPGALESCDDPADYNCDGAVGYSDGDGDGYAACEECDDTDAAQHPGATETCNSEDDDCDGDIDDDASDAPTWYTDADGDTYGDAASTTASCTQPEGTVADATDCDDADDDISPADYEVCDGEDNNCDGAIDEDTAIDAGTWYPDSDGDGYGDDDTAILSCEAPDGALAAAGDCDDADAGVNPAADEVCDGVDNNCNTYTDDGATDADTWYADSDDDGYGDADSAATACETPDGYTGDPTDCDDTDGDIYPDASEVCNGADDDCDGEADEFGATGGDPYYADEDGDGYGDPDAGISACDLPDGYVSSGDDCDDGDGSIHPGADEVCNTYDDDCDGAIDETGTADAGTWYRDSDGDGYGDASSTVESCSEPVGYVKLDTDCDDSDATVNPDASDVCNGVDDDCSGAIDDGGDGFSWYADADGDGYGDADASAYACEAPTGYVASSLDCDDSDVDINPLADEVCDSLDNDCDGVTDTDAIDAPTWYRDADKDGYGNSKVKKVQCDTPRNYVALGTDCVDTNSSIYPGADETCNGLDDDCDGDIDDGAIDPSTWYADGDDDGYGDDDTTEIACDQPTGYTDEARDCDDSDGDVHPGADEVCNDTDDDCDETADEDAVDAPTWYIDQDDDSYGSDVRTSETCDQPSGYVDNDDDCDDDNDWTFPDAAEIWDDEDNDCDGAADDDMHLGSGLDGALSVTGSTDLSTDASGSRSDPDGIAWEVTAISGSTVTVDATVSGLDAGDEVLLVNLHGSDAAHSHVGVYEFGTVTAVVGKRVTLARDVVDTYGETTNADLSGQAIVLQRVPNYSSVTVSSSGYLTTGAWDGGTGGVLALRAQGEILVRGGGLVTVDSLGYAGGATGTSYNCDSYQGESYAGEGEGDGDGACSAYNEAYGEWAPNYGGGGAHINGAGGEHAGGATDGDSWTGGSATPPYAGDTYGSADLSTLSFGSGGGGVWNGDATCTGDGPGPGGDGGGLLLVTGGTITAKSNDALTALGGSSDHCAQGSWTYGAGGGAGGSVWLIADTVSLASDAVDAQGGLGNSSNIRVGGDGGVGRVRIDCDTCNGYTAGSADAESALGSASEPDPGYLGAP